MAEQRKRGGWSNPAAAENGKHGGRPPVKPKALIEAGTPVMVSQVWPASAAHPEGGYTDLGKGAARVEARGRDRLVILEQADGSELRILVFRG